MADAPRGWRMTPADLVFLDALARHGKLTYGQICRYFYRPRTASHRLTRMQAAGLVTIDRTAQTILGRVVQPTTRGLRTVGSPLTLDKPIGESVAAFAHDVVAAELLLELEFEVGLSVVTGREIEHYEKGSAVERDEFAIERGFMRYWTDVRGVDHSFAAMYPRQKGDAPDRVRLRLPDGAYRLPNGDEVAVEVERTPKNRDRTRDILHAYTPVPVLNKLTDEWSQYTTPYEYCHWLVTPPVERLLAGADGVLFERRKGSQARCADPERPETWQTFGGKSENLPTVGVHVIEPMVAVDDGAAYSLARFDSRVATRNVSRTEWIAARTERPVWTSTLLLGNQERKLLPPKPKPEPEPTPAPAPQAPATNGPRRPAPTNGPRRPAPTGGPRPPAPDGGPRQPAPTGGPRPPAPTGGPRRPAPTGGPKPKPAS